jgi:3-hydroxybutyryl-CoA dehydratase
MHAADALFFDQLEVGREWISEPRLIRPDDIQGFADLTGDRNPIHIDSAFAATTPFRQVIAHGLLVMSLGSGLTLTSPPIRTLAFATIRDWRFVNPVFIGDEIRARNRVESVTPRGVGRRAEVVWRVQLVNQKNEAVQEGTTVTLVEGSAAVRGGRRAGGEMASA